MTLFELVAKITLDSKEYIKGLSDSESKTKTFASSLGKGLKTAAKVGAVAISAAGTAIGKVIKDSVEQYAEYEQLVGGVNKLFGESAKQVQAYAAQAYRTSQISASEYLSQATSFSAALINSLDGDTAKAAELTDVAMRSIADNFNTFGSDIESIQHAYQGFAKQNYTMLDNLKLGYGGTKSEMERLLDDAQKYADSIGRQEDLFFMTFDNIVTAIDLIQQKQGIAGTTILEAETTIQGALAMTKAAWKDLVVGLSDSNADISVLIGNLISSAGAAASNLFPTIKQALIGIGQTITEITPSISDGLLGIITDVLPELVQSSVMMISAIVSALTKNTDAIINAVFEIVDIIVETLRDPEGLMMIIDSAFSLISKLADGITESLPTLIPTIVNIVISIVQKLLENLPMLIDVGLSLLMGLVKGIVNALPLLIDAIPKIVISIVDLIVENLPLIIDVALDLIQTLVGAILDNLPLIIAAAIEIIFALMDGIIQMLPALMPVVMRIFNTINSAIIEHLPELIDGGIEIIKSIISGIVSYIGTVVETVIELVKTIVGTFADEAFRFVNAGVEMFNKFKDGFKEKIEDAKQWGKDLIQNFLDGITAKWTALKDKVKNVAQTVKDFIGFSEPKYGPLSNFHVFPKDMMDLYIKGIKDNEKRLQNQIISTFDFADLMTSPADFDFTDGFDNENSEITFESSTDRKIDQLINLVSAYLPQLANLQVVLDNGTLVGEMVSDIDLALGARAGYAARGNAV